MLAWLSYRVCVGGIIGSAYVDAPTTGIIISDTDSMATFTTKILKQAVLERE